MQPENANLKMATNAGLRFAAMTTTIEQSRRSKGRQNSAKSSSLNIQVARGLRNDFHRQIHTIKLNEELSNNEKLFLSCRSELIGLLRFSHYFSHALIERWSRKLCSIDVQEPLHGIAILDQLIADYWTAFASAKLWIEQSPESELPLAQFAREMREIKSIINRLGSLLLSADQRFEPSL